MGWERVGYRFAAHKKRMRQLRGRAHQAFDVIWQNNHMTRSEAYRWLADQMDMNEPSCHMGIFELPEQLERVVEVCNEWRLKHGYKEVL